MARPQATTSTSVPIGAKCHKAIASGRRLPDAAVRLRRPELGLRLQGYAAQLGDVVETDRGAGAVGEAHEVLHHPGVVDPVAQRERE